VAEVVQALSAAADEGLQPVLHLGDGERGEALAGQHELVADGAADTCGEQFDALLDAVLSCCDEFRGGRGSGGAQVGNEIRDGEVGLVANGGNNRQFRGGDGACESFIVESGEVFQRASAARDEDEIDLGGEMDRLINFAFALAGLALVGLALVEPADSRGDRGGAFGALHGGGIDEKVEARVAAANDLDDVVEDRAAGGGDDAEGAREGGQGALAGGIEESFGEETGLELGEGELEGTGATRFQRLGDELELAARLIDGDSAADEDGESVLRLEAEELGLAAEEHDGKLRLAVF
jgi:hypothetical protein